MTRLFASLFLLLGLVLPSLHSHAQGTIVANETDTRAALIYQLARFTEWPTNTPNTATNEPITLGVASKGGVANSLKKILKGKTINQRPIKVVSLTRWGRQKQTPDIIYVDHPSHWKRLLALGNAATLCLGSYTGFLQDGGDILLLRRDNHIAFEVHLEHLRDKGFDLHSQVLQFASKVHMEKQKP